MTQPWGRFSISWVITVGNALMAFLYSNPALLVRRPNPASRSQSLVAYIEQLGPIWIISFGVSAVVLAASLVIRRYLPAAHSLSSAVWAGYSTAVLWTALTNDPKGPYLTSSLAVVITIINLMLVVGYVDYRDRE